MAPRIAVVVATRNRPDRLGALLGALRAQTVAADGFEVIVVDDGSAPATATLLDAEGGRGGLELRVLRHPRPLGPAAARNSGWRATRAPLVAFTDDDCAPAADWLERALAASEPDPAAIVQGRTLPEPGDRVPPGVLTRTVQVLAPGPQYATCNILYPRGLLEMLGGFDEAYGPRPTAEDTDLAWRAIEAGTRTVFAPEVVVFHAVERLGALGTLRVAARWTDAMRVFAEHPQARAMLYRGRFWNVWHYLLWRTVLSLAGPRWLRGIIVARHLGQLHARAQAAGTPIWARPAALGFLLAHDAVECWTVARGAVRHRVFVL